MDPTKNSSNPQKHLTLTQVTWNTYKTLLGYENISVNVDAWPPIFAQEIFFDTHNLLLTKFLGAFD